MKKTLIIALAVLLFIAGHAQTVVPATTPISSIAAFKPGVFRFFNGKDTIEFSLVTPIHDTVITKVHDTSVITVHDTTVKTVTIHDSIFVKVPVPCPPPPKQRTVSGFPAWDPINKRWIYPYDDGSNSTL